MASHSSARECIPHFTRAKAILGTGAGVGSSPWNPISATTLRALDWSQISAFQAVVGEIKNVTSPVFTSKF